MPFLPGNRFEPSGTSSNSARGLIVGLLLGLLGLAIGGYFILKNVVFDGNFLGSRGPDACQVLTPDIAQHAIGHSAYRAMHRSGVGYTQCTYASGDRFLDVEVGGWDSTVSSEVSSSGHGNQGAGAGTYVLNTAAERETTLANGSHQGRVARKGDIGIVVVAGHYGQFIGAEAIRELAFEDGIEQKAIVKLTERL